MKRTEDIIQENCVAFYNRCYKLIPSKLIYVPNSGICKVQYRAKLKRMGMLDGCSDLTLDTGKEVVYIELKRPRTYMISPKTGKTVIDDSGGVQSDEQKQFQQDVEAMGRKYYICTSVDEFKKILQTHGVLKGGD